MFKCIYQLAFSVKSKEFQQREGTVRGEQRTESNLANTVRISNDPVKLLVRCCIIDQSDYTFFC